MHIRVDDPHVVLDLRDHLRRAGCVAVEVAPGMLQVALLGAPNADQAAREVRAYLGTWIAARGVDAEVIFDAEMDG
jgi:hypothetical protein